MRGSEPRSCTVIRGPPEIPDCSDSPQAGPQPCTESVGSLRNEGTSASAGGVHGRSYRSAIRLQHV